MASARRDRCARREESHGAARCRRTADDRGGLRGGDLPPGRRESRVSSRNWCTTTSARWTTCSWRSSAATPTRAWKPTGAALASPQPLWALWRFGHQPRRQPADDGDGGAGQSPQGAARRDVPLCRAVPRAAAGGVRHRAGAARGAARRGAAGGLVDPADRCVDGGDAGRGARRDRRARRNHGTRRAVPDADGGSAAVVDDQLTSGAASRARLWRPEFSATTTPSTASTQ